LEERGMLPLLQPGLARASLHDYRLGQILDALFAANLNRVFGALALNALEVYAISSPWLHQDTTTLTLYGGYEEDARPGPQSQPAPERPVPPRPAYGHSQDGRDDLKQVLLSLGVNREGSRSAWACAMAIRVTAQRPPWPLTSVWRWGSTGYVASWQTVRPTVNAPSGYASKSA